MKNVIVIGCGPAGLLVAHAAHRAGYMPVVLGGADPKPSHIHGAQYVHSLIPGVATADQAFNVNYIKVGTGEIYAKKIYGNTIEAERTSWFKFPQGDLPAWSIHDIYNLLWEIYQDWIFPMEVNPRNLHALRMLHRYEPIFNTAPLNLIAPNMEFMSETVNIIDGECLPDVGLNEIVYYGTEEVTAYRSGNIQGYCSTEYPGSVAVPGAQAVTKPLLAAGSAPIGVQLVGRYGCWTKGVLVDDAYKYAVGYFKGLK